MRSLRRVRIAWLLFAVGLAMRLLFWLAGPDAGAAWHAGFQGDAPAWQELAARLAHDVPNDELLLPWRPPAMLWLVAALWNGDPASALPLRWLFAVVGASIAPLFWLLLRRHVEAPIAAIAAGICAVASNLLLLGSGVQVEGLYLALVLVSLLGQARLANGGPFVLALGWGTLHGLLCLLRAEHLLTFVVLALVARCGGTRWRVLATAVAAAGAVLLPWHVHAARLVDAYNSQAAPDAMLSLPWDPAAMAAVAALPTFQHKPLAEFVDATVRVRGRRRVTAKDLDIVREAYGVWPEPLGHPLVALYGGLNFFLANSPEAAAGFSRAALDRAPPLAGGDAQYPPGLRGVLPDSSRFAFSYPPHLNLVVHGYRRGWEELCADPLAAAGRVLHKLWHAAEGATGGVGGYALPIGLSGQRRPVDLATATGPWAELWRASVLAFAAFGLFRLRHNRALWPLLAFAAVTLVVVAVFFGYARQGALCLPVVALGTAAALRATVLRRWPSLQRPRTGLVLLGLLLVLEAVRATGVGATLDGVPFAGAEPFGSNDFTPHRIEFR